MLLVVQLLLAMAIAVLLPLVFYCWHCWFSRPTWCCLLLVLVVLVAPLVVVLQGVLLAVLLWVLLVMPLGLMVLVLRLVVAPVVEQCKSSVKEKLAELREANK